MTDTSTYQTLIQVLVSFRFFQTTFWQISGVLLQEVSIMYWIKFQISLGPLISRSLISTHKSECYEKFRFACVLNNVAMCGSRLDLRFAWSNTNYLGLMWRSRDGLNCFSFFSKWKKLYWLSVFLQMFLLKAMFLMFISCDLDYSLLKRSVRTGAGMVCSVLWIRTYELAIGSTFVFSQMPFSETIYLVKGIALSQLLNKRRGSKIRFIAFKIIGQFSWSRLNFFIVCYFSA